MSVFSPDKVHLVQKLSIHNSDVTSCDFSNHLCLATGSGDKKVVICEWKKDLGFVEASYSPLIGHKYSITCVRFSSSHLLATTSVDGHTILWDIKNGRSIHTLVQANGLGVRVLAFSGDGAMLVSAGEGGTFCLWSIQPNSVALSRAVSGHDDESIQGTAFSPDSNLLVTGDVTGSYKIWSVEYLKDNQDTSLVLVRDAHDLGINGMEFSPQHSVITNEENVTQCEYTMLSCGNDHNIAIWSVILICGGKTAGEKNCYSTLQKRLIGHSSAVSQIRISLDGSLLASTSIDKTTRIWQLSNEKCVKILEGHSRYVTSAAFSSDGSLLVTGSNDRLVFVWDLTGQFGINSEMPTMNLSPTFFTNEEIDSEKDDKMDGVQLVEKLVAHSSAVNSCHFGPSLFISGGSDRKISIWKWFERTFTLSKLINDAHRFTIHQVELSPSEKTLVSASLDGTAIIWDSHSGEVEKSGFHISGSGIRCARFSPDGELLAVGGETGKDKYEVVSGGMDCLVKVWNMKLAERSMMPVWSLSGHGGNITCVRYSPKLAELLASTSTDKTCRIWDSYSGNCLHIVENHDSIMTCCAFSPDATLLATGSMDKSVSIWELPKNLSFQLFVSSRLNPSQPTEELLAGWLERSGINPSAELTSSDILETPIEELLDKIGIVEENRRAEIERLIKSLREEPPHDFICPITQHIMRDPVIAPDGYRYEKTAIEAWLGSGEKRSPMTNENFDSVTLEPDVDLKNRIKDYLRE
ncbi:WD repeat, SAM and U-box domain-containing protein 1 isoform X2 [Halyomorpha halys]|uniref:WD repeat, SAM and U-box domain-containing protein 1 isoform X2 n=1 Tax=Halyomorpha halys TaxID=286706 RepID=UPI0006D4E50F|nr:WD repeat, SAM and U-box domain-containing protein 1-like isoform X2 [Halyomorpha halys]